MKEIDRTDKDDISLAEMTEDEIFIKELQEHLGDDMSVSESDGVVTVSGRSYMARHYLKMKGFVWNPDEKHWYRIDPYGKHSFTLDEPLPPNMASDIDMFMQFNLEKYKEIGKELGIPARCAAILGNIGILYGCGEIYLSDDLTEIIKDYVDIVPAKDAGLDGYADGDVYKLKPEYEHLFSFLHKEN